MAACFLFINVTTILSESGWTTSNIVALAVCSRGEEVKDEEEVEDEEERAFTSCWKDRLIFQLPGHTHTKTNPIPPFF